MPANPAQQLISFGQSVWYDNISRDIIRNGEVSRLVREWGVRGITSNPSIFDKAIRTSTLYDPLISEFSKQGLTSDQIFEEIAIRDVAEAADLLRPVYDESNGNDGFVSIEVSPLLAADSSGTVSEAKRLFERLNRPNIMIKIPGTVEGISAVKEALLQGINVNVTLLFSVENYIQVAKTYCEAMQERLALGLPVSKIRSVASFFVSRVDTLVDKLLEEIARSSSDIALQDKALSLQGRFGIANSKMAYQQYLSIFENDEFRDLRATGAEPQRPLWASTSTKNPIYRDVIYVEELIGQNTVNTIPPETLAAFVDHGNSKQSLLCEVEMAKKLPKELEGLGIDLDKVFTDLQSDGVSKFVESFKSLNIAISKKLSC